MKAYKCMMCNKCKKTTIVLAEEYNKKNYLVCSHCTSRSVRAIKETDDLRECLKHSSYKKEHGRIRQVTYDE